MLEEIARLTEQELNELMRKWRYRGGVLSLALSAPWRAEGYRGTSGLKCDYRELPRTAHDRSRCIIDLCNRCPLPAFSAIFMGH